MHCIWAGTGQPYCLAQNVSSSSTTSSLNIGSAFSSSSMAAAACAAAAERLSLSSVLVAASSATAVSSSAGVFGSSGSSAPPSAAGAATTSGGSSLLAAGASTFPSSAAGAADGSAGAASSPLFASLGCGPGEVTRFQKLENTELPLLATSAFGLAFSSAAAICSGVGTPSGYRVSRVGSTKNGARGISCFMSQEVTFSGASSASALLAASKETEPLASVTDMTPL
mmetsp:Transcript_31679/g.82956  ORF Transcript_31679/g.82956 Transcript_31679/m.82956 type:complete len:226 (+) Transcript_31679:2509-3186(+)